MLARLSFGDFADMFKNSTWRDNYTYNGLRALFDYIEESDDGQSDETVVDCGSLACDWSEYESDLDWAYDNDVRIGADTYEPLTEEQALAHIQGEYFSIVFDTGILVSAC